jgi:hypothetical protein
MLLGSYNLNIFQNYTKIVEYTRPKGDVWITANTSVNVNFNPSSPQGSPRRMPSPMVEGKSREVFQRWLERIKNMSLDEYMRLSEEEKKKIIEEYVEWRLRASGYKQVTNRMKILFFPS